MTPVIVHSSENVTLLGGGEATRGDLEEALSLAPTLVAADGGAAHALGWGQTPEAVIGDLDSLPRAARFALPRETIHRIEEQDSTDFDKALRSIAAPLVVGVGCLGARFDHSLAALNGLVRRADRRVVLIGSEDVVFAAPPRLELSLEPGTRVSLFPMAPVAGQSEGLQWPVEGLEFAPHRGIGTSNRADEDGDGKVRLTWNSAGMVVILPRGSLAEAIRALLAAEPWPVSALAR